MVKITAELFSNLLFALCLSPGHFKPNPKTPISLIPVSEGPLAVGSQSTSATYRVRSPPSRQAPPPPSGAHMSSACSLDPYSIQAVDLTFSPFDETMANVYRYRQQQSVNLGSWFVHEQWMTPSLFLCAAGRRISELDIAEGWGSLSNARTVLERHWDTFINQSDFQYLASIGINTVRLPVGYWNLGPSFCQGTPFNDVADVYQNSWSRIVQAIKMAEQAGIGVMVDLHGAVGSQNGQPHSGISDGAVNLFTNETNMQKTIDVLTFLVKNLCLVTNVVGIQILNEPQNVPQLTKFYTRAISAMRRASPAAAEFPLYIHDGFDLDFFSKFVATRTDFVVQDHHSYFVFTPSDASEPASQHSGDVQTTVSDSLSAASAQQHRNLVVDEWSCALTPQSMHNESDKVAVRQTFCTGQMSVYTNTTAGWAFWSYKKEDCFEDPGWCFLAAVDIFLPSSFFLYGQAIPDPARVQSLGNLVSLPPLPDLLARAKGWIESPTQAAPRSTRRILSSSLRNSPHYRHRLASVHYRRFKRDAYSGTDMTDEQRSIVKGYSDGFTTARLFATYNTSKLGFVGQYIADSLTALRGTVIASGTEIFYRDGFTEGLKEGEEAVSAIINQ